MKPGFMIGSAPVPVRLTDTRVDLAPGDTLILYTDGYLEATAPDGTTEFGLDRLRDALGGARAALTLEAVRRRGGGGDPAVRGGRGVAGRSDAGAAAAEVSRYPAGETFHGPKRTWGYARIS